LATVAVQSETPLGDTRGGDLERLLCKKRKRRDVLYIRRRGQHVETRKKSNKKQNLKLSYASVIHFGGGILLWDYRTEEGAKGFGEKKNTRLVGNKGGDFGGGTKKDAAVAGDNERRGLLAKKGGKLGKAKLTSCPGRTMVGQYWMGEEREKVKKNLSILCVIRQNPKCCVVGVCCWRGEALRVVTSWWGEKGGKHATSTSKPA